LVSGFVFGGRGIHAALGRPEFDTVLGDQPLHGMLIIAWYVLHYTLKSLHLASEDSGTDN
jgi:hypothetical protein